MDETRTQELPYTVTLDDDKIICKLIEDIVGLKTFSFETATELLQKKSLLNPIGVFVDVNLAQDECGIDNIPELRRTRPNVPIIVMTADDRDSLVTEALSAGAHDFVMKPLRPVEVVARLNARREELKNRTQTKLIKYGDLVLDLQHRIITGPKGQSFQSAKELQILAYLMRSDGMIVEKSALKQQVWGPVVVSDNALDRKLFEVRKSIKEVSDKVEMKSVYGKGIALRNTTYEDDQVLLEDKEFELNRMTAK